MSSLIWRGLGAACKNPIHIIVVRGVGTEEGACEEGGGLGSSGGGIGELEPVVGFYPLIDFGGADLGGRKDR